jgi:autotransporter-associated beta strand protein
LPTTARAETWNVGTGTADWNTAANWTNPSSVPNSVGAAAIFDSTTVTVTANRVATLSSDVTVGSILFDNSTVRTNTIGLLTGAQPNLIFDAAGSGPATLTVTGTNGTGSATSNNIFSPTVLNDNLVIDSADGATTSAAGEFTFRAGSLTGAGGITKNGTGVITFADNPKAYTGPTVINNGRLRLNATANMTGTSSITVNPGGQLDIEGPIDYTFGSDPNVVITLNGFGLGATSPAGNFPGAIRTGSGLSQYIENKMVLASDSSINVVSTNPVTAQGRLTLVNEVSGPGQLIANQRVGIISREGFLLLGHSNTYSGGTAIEQGTLIVTPLFSADANLGTGTVLVSGNILGPGGDAAGDTYGKLVIETGVTNAITNTAYLNITGGGASATPDRGFANLGTGIDETVGGLMLGGVIQGAGTYGSTASSATFQSDEYFSGSGIVTVVPAGVPADYNNNGTVDAGDYTLWRKGGPLANDFTPGVQSTDYDFWRSRFGANTNPGSGSGLQNSAVPEPSTVVLIGCLAPLLIVGRRRKSVLVSLRETNSPPVTRKS